MVVYDHHHVLHVMYLMPHKPVLKKAKFKAIIRENLHLLLLPCLH